MGILSTINAIVLTFILAELIITIVFTKNWKFRFRRARGHPQLTPFSKTWKVVSITLLLVLVILPILDYLLWPQINILIQKLGIYQWNLLFFLLPVAYLWTEKKIIGRKWNLYDLIPASISFLSLAIGVLIYVYR